MDNPKLDRIFPAAYTAAMNLGTRLFTWWHGARVGSDDAGNVYFEDRRARPGAKPRRWVIFAGAADASAVPAEWSMWLHSTSNAPLQSVPRRPWQKPHLPNLTGTALAYRPPGHDYAGGERPRNSADYEAWTPGS